MRWTANILCTLLFVAFTLLAIASAPADNGTDLEVRRDLVLMQGKWKLVDFVYYSGGNVNRIPEDQRSGLRVVNGNKYRLTLRIGGQNVNNDYSFKLYPDRNPKAFDVTMPDGRIVKGIYEVNGQTLRRCYSQPNAPRPVQFKTGTQTYQEWKRIQ